MEERAKEYVDYLVENTTIKRKTDNSIIMTIEDEEIKCKYNIRKMFDEYMGIKKTNMTRQDIEYFLGNYIYWFKKKRNKIDDDNFFIDLKVDEFINYMLNVSEQVSEEVEEFFSTEPWLENVEPYIGKNIDVTKSKARIKKEFKKFLKKELIPMIIIDKIDTWWEFWSEY